MQEQKRILVAVLDWGLGHATRCVPLIKKLRQEGHIVVVAAGGKAADFLKIEFSDLEIIPFRGYGIRYSTLLPMSLMMLLQSPKILFHIVREHFWLKKIIQKHRINSVISDNCYGLWNNRIESIFITHQLMIKCPEGMKWLEPALHSIVKWFVSRYDECWIPDVAGENNLSGDLSHKFPLPENARFIGNLSRFGFEENKLFEKSVYDVCAIISGPEPHRTRFEKKCLEVLKKQSGKSILILGKPGNISVSESRENIRIASHLNTAEMQYILLNAKHIICRSGYSGIMDLRKLQKGAYLVPTPGQTEQEYLAGYLDGKFGFKMVKELEEINLE